MAERTRGRRAALLSGLVLALALGSLGVHQLNRNTGDREHGPAATLADRATARDGPVANRAWLVPRQ